MVLSEEQKAFIVRCLACFDTPSEVAALVKEEWNIDIRREQVRSYNPQQCDVAEKWRQIFETTREEFLKSQAEIGIAHKSYRLKVLNDVMHKALQKKNFPLVLQCLEQGAKDSGGAFTNQRDINAKVAISGIDELLAATEDGEG